MTRDLLHPLSSGDEARTLFLPVDVSFLKQLTQVFQEQGFIEALHTASAYQNTLVSNIAMWALDIRKNQLLFNPSTRYKSLDLIQQYSQTRNWLNYTIRNIVWHPHCQKVAVVTCDDAVRIYNCDNNLINPLLRHKQQKHITCLAWRPLSHTEIAVGHENGIILWNVDPKSLVK